MPITEWIFNNEDSGRTRETVTFGKAVIVVMENDKKVQSFKPPGAPMPLAGLLKGGIGANIKLKPQVKKELFEVGHTLYSEHVCTNPR